MASREARVYFVLCLLSNKLIVLCLVAKVNRLLLVHIYKNLNLAFIKIWNFETLEFVTQFKDHRGPITSLTFRKSDTAIELITASTDRSLKV